MILYHTSDREIPKPDIHYGRKNADFARELEAILDSKE